MNAVRTIPDGASGSPVVLGATPRRGAVAWAAVGVAGLLGVLSLSSAESLLAGLPACAMREVFHIGCATCGFARAALHLARGEVGASWMLHPFATIVAIEGVVAWAAWGASLWRGRFVVPAWWWVRVLGVTVLAALVFWLVRLGRGTIPI